MSRLLLFGAGIVLTGAAWAQSAVPVVVPSVAPAVVPDPEPSGWHGKLRYHAMSAYGPGALAGAVVYDGFLQAIDFPKEWGRGWTGYGKRLGSTLAYSGTRNLIGFALDTALREDPRYHRSGEGSMFHRAKHAFRGTILTRTDSGRETLAIWRLGSAYAATFISNEWYPDRVNTVALGLTEGTTQIGFDLLANLGSEFWPDVKRKLHRRRP